MDELRRLYYGYYANLKDDDGLGDCEQLSQLNNELTEYLEKLDGATRNEVDSRASAVVAESEAQGFCHGFYCAMQLLSANGLKVGDAV